MAQRSDFMNAIFKHRDYECLFKKNEHQQKYEKIIADDIYL